VRPAPPGFIPDLTAGAAVVVTCPVVESALGGKRRNEFMTVKELRDALAKLEPNMDVYVYWERDNQTDIFDIDHVAKHRGIAKRIGDKKAFAFDSNGKDEHVFISVTGD
jgi:hypothetical protein